MPKYKFDALRYCRNNAGRLHLPDGPDPMDRIAEELHMMATALRAKDADYVALRNAAVALLSDVDEYFRCADISESRDKLAALVGEG